VIYSVPEPQVTLLQLVSKPVVAPVKEYPLE
jgi:hypothetical protein